MIREKQGWNVRDLYKMKLDHEVTYLGITRSLKVEVDFLGEMFH